MTRFRKVFRMRPIEQALISVRANEIDKEVRFLRSSNGLAAIDREEILGWSQAFEIPPDGRFDLLNLFFHHLPSGDYAVGRLTPSIPPNGAVPTTPARLRSFFIQTMVVDPETFLSFGNNPIFLYQKALSSGRLTFMAHRIPEVTAIPIEGENRWLDPGLLRGMIVSPGIEAIVRLLRSTLDAPCTLFTGGPPAVHIISALFNLLPVDCRPELTFSTGLHFSPDRYLRLIGVAKKNPRLAEIRDRYPVPFLNLDRLAVRPSRPIEPGWAELAEAVLRSGRFDLFHRKLAEEYIVVREREESGLPFSIPSAAELNRLGAEWLAELGSKFAARPNAATPDNSEKRAEEKPKLGDEQKLGRIFRLRKPPIDSNDPPLTIPEKLRRWLLEPDPDETILFYQDKRHDEETSERKRPSPFNPPFFSAGSERDKSDSETNRPALPAPKPPAGRIPFEEPLMIYAERNRLFSPYQRLMAVWPGHEERLLELDSQIAAVLRGDYCGAESLAKFWQKLCEELPNEVEWAIREEYIHYIQALLTFEGDIDGVKSPKKSLSALEVLDLFLNELPL